jgi:ubiquinone/menaquinone biosynthesis C-methylase UbiE
MRMNRLETWMMNNPVRAAAQRWHAGPLFERLGGRTEGLRVLEPGCGRGVGVEILLERFGAARVDAFDFDPEMVGLARRRLARYGERVKLWEGSATSIPAADGTYDAVFTFGVLHHVPAWREALAEVRRVLKPGGRLFAEESFASFITHPVWSRLLHHPQEDRFDAAGLRREFERYGLRVTGEELGFGESLGWFVAVRD